MHWVRHSACGGRNTASLWMDHHHEFCYHKKCHDALVISMSDVILPVVKSQGSKVKTPVASITRQNK